MIDQLQQQLEAERTRRLALNMAEMEKEKIRTTVDALRGYVSLEVPGAIPEDVGFQVMWIGFHVNAAGVWEPMGLVSKDEACRLLGISLSRFWREKRAGRLVVKKIGTRSRKAFRWVRLLRIVRPARALPASARRFLH